MPSSAIVWASSPTSRPAKPRRCCTGRLSASPSPRPGLRRARVGVTWLGQARIGWWRSSPASLEISHFNYVWILNEGPKKRAAGTRCRRLCISLRVICSPLREEPRVELLRGPQFFELARHEFLAVLVPHHRDRKLHALQLLVLTEEELVLHFLFGLRVRSVQLHLHG